MTGSPRGRAQGSARQRDRGSLRFLRVFIMGWLGLTLALLMIPPVPPFFRVATARSLGWCLRVLGLPAIVNGDVVAFPPAGAFEIITECTAIYIVPIFMAAVLAAPVGWRERWGALGWGIPLLLAFNLARLVVLAEIMVHWPGAFDFFHEYLWQVLFGATVIVAWWFWCESALRRQAALRSAAPVA